MTEETLERRVAKLEAEIAGIVRLETKIDKLIERMDKVVALEQSQIGHSSALERAFGEVKAAQNQLKEHIDADEVEHKTINDIISRGKGAWWVASILWGAMGAALVAGLFSTAKEVIDLRTQVQVLERVQSAHIDAAKAAGVTTK